MSSDSTSVTSMTLLSKLEANDPDAWERFVRLYGPLVYSWSRHLGVDPGEVADIAQEVFSVVAQKLPQFDPNRVGSGGFRAWLWGITRNKILEHFRKRHRAIPIEGCRDGYGRLMELRDSSREPEMIGGNNPQRLLLQTAVEMLKETADPVTWQAFWYMAIDGREARDIGNELGMSPRAVRQAKFRVTRKLRALLGEDFLPAPEISE